MPEPGERIRSLRWEFKFEPRDLWVGVYWTRKLGWPPERKRHSPELRSEGTPSTLEVYVCVLPTLLVHVSIPRAIPLAYWQEHPERDFWNADGSRRVRDEVNG